MRSLWVVGYGCVLPLLLFSQASQKDRDKAQISRIHELEKNGTGGLVELSGFLKDPDRPVRVAAVNAIVDVGSTASLDPLLAATHDSDAEVRVRATDGIVNVYVPGYVANTGLSGYFTRGLHQVKLFFSERNDKVIDDDVKVRDGVGPALAQEVNFGNEMTPRSNAALAAGILRLEPAVPALEQALHSKDNDLIFESLVALQKIHDPSAGESVGFLVRDLDERTQVTALETVGVLHGVPAASDVRYALNNARNAKIRRAALSALAMLAVPEDRTVFRQYVMNSDPALRAAALEGLGRLREPEDMPALQTSYDEASADWRIHLAAAFALVNEGNVSTEEFSPLPYLVENLNSRQRADTANAYLKELIHHDDVRKNIVNTMAETTKAQKLALCWIFGQSHASDLMPTLQKLAGDADGEVETAAKRAEHVLETRRD